MTAFIALSIILQLLAMGFAMAAQTSISRLELALNVIMSLGSASGALIAMWIAGGLS